ncbi:MAG: glycosyltransferase [Planctomycetota bacterium]|nr:glycosyltransferase [Planctomycetaceae bacterium]MDQ3330620.1 glycosyltransferase [Planctomycetota bacterium]
MPLRVLFAIGSMEVGGAERQLLRYLKHLDRQKFSPGLYLVAKRGPLLDELPAGVPVFAFDERVPPARIYLPGGIHRKQIHDLGRVLDEFEADVLVTRTFHLTLIGAPAARRRPTPLVAIDASDPRRDFHRNAGRFRLVKRRLIESAYKRAAAVVALSDGAANGLSTFYNLPRNRVIVLSNAIDFEEINGLAAKPAPGLEPDRFHVVAIGRLVPEKGHRYLIDAAARLIGDGNLPNLRVHLLGDGPLRSVLERFAAERGIAENIHFVGFCRNPFSYLRRCDLFCLPSLNEGMPGALLEAMACGIPVIASDCESGPREVLADGRFGTLVPVGDPVSLAAAIREKAQHPAAARETAQLAREHVERVYSTPIVIARLETLLEDVVAGDSAR